MSKLFVCRHTETVYNKEGIFSGKLDTPLSDKGILQAREMATIINDEKIDVVITSSLLRSKETAGILMAVYHVNVNSLPPLFVNKPCEDNDGIIPIYSDARLDERSYGILEGKKKDLILQQYGIEQLHSWRRSWDCAPANGETLEQVCTRVESFMKEVIVPLLNKGKNTLLVCHQNSMRAIKILVENIPVDQVENIEFYNGQIISFSFNKDSWLTGLE